MFSNKSPRARAIGIYAGCFSMRPKTSFPPRIAKSPTFPTKSFRPRIASVVSAFIAQTTPTTPSTTRLPLKAGRRFAVNEAAFFINEVDIWTNEAEDEFDYATEFNYKTTRVQAQIQDLLRLLPNDARSRRTQE
ncbi:hypothetical protein R3P38DRAFT_3293762 [Favolaschia claudopus]|uniref:Uncharacterized protein n=1 Tax=Favolaschia claudopus TaxID=2862362 RepID=A0AAV9ZH05_9AGAR